MDDEYEHAVESMDVNYFGTKNLTEQLLPLLKPSPAGARIVNLNSSAGWLVVRSPI
jgi:NAD(P)-dependent dehydrogenase (short-subunit alcohol dehydrogenase family)